MTSFPTGYGRAPSLLFSSINLSHLAKTNAEIFRVSQQLSTGLDLLRPSDDIVRAATISALDARIERSDQLIKNFGYAASSLDTIDQALGDAFDLVNEATGIALTQIQSTSTAEERKGQAIVVDSIIDSLYRVGSRKSLVGYIFGGTNPGSVPFEAISGGFRFLGERGGMTTDLGVGLNIPVTLGAQNAVGALSNRVEGTVDLDPDLELETKISDLNGARDLGVNLGVIQASFNGDEPFQIDLTDADTVGDVVDAISSAIAAYEASSGNTVLGAGGVTISGEAISIDVDAGASGSLVFSDIEGGSTAADLGLDTSGFPPLGVSLGNSLDPRLTWTSSLASLSGLAGSLGEIKLTNNGKVFNIDLSGAETLADVRSLLERGGTDVRVELNEDATGINVVTQIAGTPSRALSIAEVSGGSNTAELLGIRSFSRETAITAFNDGRGVDIVSGRADPDGVIDPDLNVDFTITLDEGGPNEFTITVDLSPDDVLTVGSVIDAINAQANAQLTAAGRPTGDFTALLSDGDNGIVFTQAPGGNAMSIEPRNNSTAAQQLGLLDATPLNGTDSLIGEDRATVRVDNVFTALLDLSEALRQNSTVGIQFASDRLEDMVERLTEQRALVGGYARRVEEETLREEDRNVLDTATRSSLRDVDFAAASTRFSLLQTQLQAGLLVTSQAQQQTLLNFLG